MKPFNHVLSVLVPKLSKAPANPAAFAAFVVNGEAGYWPGFNDGQVGADQYAANEQRVFNLTPEAVEAKLAEWEKTVTAANSWNPAQNEERRKQSAKNALEATQAHASNPTQVTSDVALRHNEEAADTHSQYEGFRNTADAHLASAAAFRRGTPLHHDIAAMHHADAAVNTHGALPDHHTSMSAAHAKIAASLKK